MFAWNCDLKYNFLNKCNVLYSRKKNLKKTSSQVFRSEMQFCIIPGRENTKTKTFHIFCDSGEFCLGSQMRNSNSSLSAEHPSFV